MAAQMKIRSGCIQPDKLSTHTGYRRAAIRDELQARESHNCADRAEWSDRQRQGSDLALASTSGRFTYQYCLGRGTGSFREPESQPCTVPQRKKTRRVEPYERRGTPPHSSRTHERGGRRCRQGPSRRHLPDTARTLTASGCTSLSWAPVRDALSQTADRVPEPESTHMFF
jgi:hypothetical protein